ncbi:hypothetical protein [Chitinophaga rhizophila]|uniref:Uncharacterized protein n=1 Tax=Chitinophaga rhizophila TaxID=2866212 RepID=A0ABS7GKI1_9BACT|nr:hypothetical protein [Chitinophaga rhizophila]MBW8687254.1 hypothetical protein [Chitinophaga rhizophila]
MISILLDETYIMIQDAKTRILNAFRKNGNHGQLPAKAGDLLAIGMVNYAIGPELRSYRDDALQELVDEGILIKADGNSATTASGSVEGYRITELGVRML